MTEHVSEAILKATAISEQVLKDPAALSDELLIADGGALKKLTLQVVQTLIRSGLTTIPVGTILDFAGDTEPENYLFCFGQEVSRVTYEALFNIIGVTYGAGNGTSSFLLPDLRGRIIAGRDDLGGVAANRLTNPWVTASNTLGATGGAQSNVMTAAQMPSHQHTGVDHLHLVPAHQHAYTGVMPSFTGTGRGSGTSFSINNETRVTDAGSGAVWTGGADRALTTGFAGSNSAQNNTQPTIVLNKIIRFI
jgi:microcystin-dependent protein